MKGRKPNLKNVIPMRSDDVGDDERVAEAIERKVRLCMPSGLSKAERAVFRRLGRILAVPHLDRLKPHFGDALRDLSRDVLDCERLWKAMPEAGRRFYRPVKDGEGGRNGSDQLRAHPNVVQYADARTRVRQGYASFGMTPQDERNILPGQGELFDAADKYFG